MSTQTSQWNIEPATPKDISTLQGLDLLATANDPLMNSFRPTSISPTQKAEYFKWREALHKNSLQRPNTHFYKIVDRDTNKIIASSGWYGPPSYVPNLPSPPTVPTFIDSHILSELNASMHLAKQELGFGMKSFWFLRVLSVHPDFQRNGLGTALLEHGLRELVDRDGLEAYLESTSEAKGFYEKCGFVERRVLRGVWEGEVVVMVRDAKEIEKKGERVSASCA